MVAAAVFALILYAIDRAMMQADGTDDKSHFGANAILATSIACCRAAATSLDIPLKKREFTATFSRNVSRET